MSRDITDPENNSNVYGVTFTYNNIIGTDSLKHIMGVLPIGFMKGQYTFNFCGLYSGHKKETESGIKILVSVNRIDFPFHSLTSREEFTLTDSE